LVVKFIFPLNSEALRKKGEVIFIFTNYFLVIFKKKVRWVGVG
jgi:hypothetical protein